jgi:4'-phosphopantetheinyl transferase
MIESGVIHVWRAATSVCAGESRFAAGRAALRLILASYVDADPAALRFDTGRHGKPALRGHSGLEFSFSRSAEAVLVGVAADRAVGVDVERIDFSRPVGRLARRWLGPAEAAEIAALPMRSRGSAFHRCWTAKEAYAKGVGAGLAAGFQRFSVTGPGPRRAVDHPGAGAAPWTVEQLPLPAGYVGAIAAPGPDWRVELLSWEVAGD